MGADGGGRGAPARGGHRGSRGGRGGPRKGGGPPRDDAPAAPLVAGGGKHASSSIVPEGSQDEFLELAKQMAAMARAETASHEALAKRVETLERSLDASRRELADLRVRNNELTKELAKSAAAREAAAPPTPAA